MTAPTSITPDLHDDEELDEHDRGLLYDLGTIDRRRMLQMLGFGGVSAGLFTILGCGPGAASASIAAVGERVGDAGGRQLCGHPRGDRRPVPG